MTVIQMQNEAFDQVLEQYADLKSRQVLEISAAAGWGGDTVNVQHRVQKLIELAATIRMSVKAGITPVGLLQPWVTRYRDRFDAKEMIDVSEEVPRLLNMGNGEGCHVLGSTGLGLRVRTTGDEGPPSAELEGLRLKTRVLLCESFGR
jgi:hypothetical protein